MSRHRVKTTPRKLSAGGGIRVTITVDIDAFLLRLLASAPGMPGVTAIRDEVSRDLVSAVKNAAAEAAKVPQP